MTKEAHRIFGRDPQDRPTDGLYERPANAGGAFSQQRFDLREGFLYGIQVRRVGWQVKQREQPTPSINSRTLSPL